MHIFLSLEKNFSDFPFVNEKVEKLILNAFSLGIKDSIKSINILRVFLAQKIFAEIKN